MEDKDTRVIGGKNIARSWVTWTIGTGQMCPYVGETTDYTLAVTCMEFKTTVIDVAMRQLQYNEVFETKPFLIELQIDCKMRLKKL